MNKDPDVIVVGGGPSGSFAALKLAELGVEVTVFEEHSEIGVPSHCAGHLSIRGLKRLGIHSLPDGIIENTYRGADFYSPRGHRFSVNLTSPITCSINRALFDKHLAKKAQEAGANYLLDSRVESLTIKNGTVKGVLLKHKAETKTKQAKIIIDAEGISSRILRQTCLPGLDRQMVVNGVESEVENVKDLESDTVEVYLGATYAPGLYAWLMPKKDGKAKVGLAAKATDPRKLLKKLMVKHPVASTKLRNARIAQMTVHPITLGGPIPKTVSNGFLAVGDAASHVKSTTGGGVIFGMTCAAIAAEVTNESVLQNDYSSDFLSIYQKRCNKTWSFDSRTMLRIRKTLDAMSDERLDNLIEMCKKLGVDKTLQNVEDLDLQGRTLMRVLRSPRMFTAITYFLFAYLFPNL